MARIEMIPDGSWDGEDELRVGFAEFARYYPSP